LPERKFEIENVCSSKIAKFANLMLVNAHPWRKFRIINSTITWRIAKNLTKLPWLIPKLMSILIKKHIKKNFHTRKQTHCIDHQSPQCHNIRILLKHIQNTYCSNAASDISQFDIKKILVREKYISTRGVPSS
jgi:hypothetical protein